MKKEKTFGEENILNRTPMERIIKLVSRFIYYVSIIFFGYGLLSFGQAFINQGYNITTPDINQLFEVNGVLNKASFGKTWGIVVNDFQSNTSYSCNIGDCGYENIQKDIGNVAKLLIYKNIVYQIEVNNVVKLSYAESASKNIDNIFDGIKYILFGVILIVISKVRKPNNRRNH